LPKVGAVRSAEGMKIGLALSIPPTPLPVLLDAATQAAAVGFPAVWFNDIGGWDPLTVAALVGERVPGLEVGTAITQLLGRHPLHLAGQTLTAQAATGGRLTLGVGPSHAPIVEQRFGLSWERPILQVRERLDLLRSLLAGETVDVRGATIAAAGEVVAPGATAPPVLLAAHGPQMLRLAGERADGVLTLWSRPGLVADFVAPTVRKAAAGAGRPAPRIVVGLNTAVTTAPEATREYLAEKYAAVGSLPSYRGSLDRQGATGIEETIVVGDEATVAAAVRDYEAAGATELIVFASGRDEDRDQTLAALAHLAREAGR
jgi:F420-dependent oxidoreductase-like protein